MGDRLKKRYGLREDLFGRRCTIQTGYNKCPFVYRILRSGVMSNCWSEIPLTHQTETSPVCHDHKESVLFVVVDTLIDDRSRIIRVAEKDVVLVPEN